MLSTNDKLTYRGDLTAICQLAISQLSCSESRIIPLTVQLNGMMQDGSQLPVLERDVQAEVSTLKCTATPIPTKTPLPTATPTPVPDRDGDGINDLSDRCAAFYGTSDLQGCPSLVYPLSTLGGGIVLLVLVLGVMPWAKVHTYGKPPAGFVQVFRSGKPVSQPIAIDEAGVKKRATRVTVGGAHKATITVEGLQPVEFYIEKRGGNVALRENGEKEPFAFFDSVPRMIHTSDPKVVLKIGLDRSTF
jgi:hypothetical protein